MMMRHLNTVAAFATLTGMAALLASPACAQGTTGHRVGNNANVTLYGLIDTTLRHIRNTTSGDSSTRMSDGSFTGSRWGLRGREQLSPDVAAVFTLEAGFHPSNGSSLQSTAVANYGQTQGARLFGRQIHLGVEGKDWSVVMGRQYTLAHTLAARWQPQGNPNSQALAVFSNHHIARQDNMLRVNAKVAGVELSATRTFGQVFGSDSDNAAWALGASTRIGPAQLGAYVQRMNNLTGTQTRKLWGLGGNYRLTDSWQVFAGFARRTTGGSAQANKVGMLGVGVALTANLSLSAAHLRDHQSGGARFAGKRRGSWAAASYRLSPRTDVYVVIDNNKIDGRYARPAWMQVAGTQTGIATGLRHRF